jgi:hypothetical protein
MKLNEEDEQSHFPTPEDKPGLGMGSLELTSRQLVVLRLLKAHNERLPEIFLGALQALHDKPHDFIAVAAHCLRDLMDLAFTWSQGPSESNPKTHEQLNRIVRKPWKTLQKDLANGHEPGNVSSLELFLEAFARFLAWHDEHRTVAIERAGAALRRLQRRRGTPDTFDRDRQAWHDVLSALKPIAHHRKSSEEELRHLLDDVELLLLRYLRPSEPEKLQQIERVVGEAGATPGQETLDTIKTMLDGSHDRRAFFAAIRKASWLPLLLQDGWFDPKSPNGPKAEHPNAGGPEVDLLLRLAADASEDVAKAAFLLAKMDDDWVHHHLLQLALKLPARSRETFVDLAATWIEARWGSFILSRALVEFAGPVVQSGITGDVERLISTALKVHPDPRCKEKQEQREAEQSPFSLLSLEPEPTLDSDAAQDFVTQLLNSVQAQDRLSLLRLIASALSEDIRNRIWPDELDERGSYDGSVFWRESVEAGNQLLYQDQRDILVTAVRDLAEGIISHQPTDFAAVEEALAASPWMIFKRIRIHLLRTYPEAARPLRIRECLFDDEVRNGTDGWHEWMLLLREQFRHLSTADQNAILDWITAEPDLSGAIMSYLEFNQGRSPTTQETDAWKADRWRRKLAIIKDSIPEDWKAAHPALCDGLDEVEPIEFHYRSSGGRFIVGDQCHLTVDEIVNMPPAELVARLADWKERDPYDGPSESGLLIALKAAGKQNPAQMLARLHEYDGLRPTRHVALLDGLWEAADAGASVDWRFLLEATENEIQDRVLPHDRARDIKREASLGPALVRAIQTALSKDHLPRECRREVFKCIEAFLTHPDPAPADEETETLPERLSFTSLNTPRPIALRCVFEYDKWLRRGKVDDSPEVLPVLEGALNNEPTLAGRSVFGEQMNWFLRHHRAWLEARLPSFFPESEPKKRDAVWNCFVTMCPASKAALEIFRSEYLRAVEECRSEPTEKPSSDWSPQKGLVRHLWAYYWWGYESRESPSLLTAFFETGTTNLREYAFRDIAEALDKTEVPLPESMAKRFMDLADWRIKEFKDAKPRSPETMELRGIVRWANCEKLPPEWMLQRLLDVLKLLSCSGLEHQLLPFDFLAKQVSSYPALAMGCLHEFTLSPGRSGKKTPPWWGQEDEAKTILRTALASGLPDVVRQAEEVQDHLLRLGRLEYRNLEPKGD